MTLNLVDYTRYLFNVSNSCNLIFYLCYIDFSWFIYLLYFSYHDVLPIKVIISILFYIDLYENAYFFKYSLTLESIISIYQGNVNLQTIIRILLDYKYKQI